MINQMNQNENTQNEFSYAIKELKLGKLLRQSNINKNCGIHAFEVFQILLLLVFQGKNLFRFLNSKHKEQAVSKNTNTSVFFTATLGWTDGYSFIPVGFNMLSSAKKFNRYQEMSDIDHRTNGYKVRRDSMLSKLEASVKLIMEALDAGIAADYVLMDTWFTTEPMIQSILELGLDVIGMVKQLKQRYYFNGRAYTLPELQKFVNYN